MSACGECTDGAIWPMASDSDYFRPYVERCDTCKAFSDDEEAAEFVAGREGGIVVLATHHDMGERWQPAVYPWPKEYPRLETT